MMTIGIDVSKDKIDCAWLRDSEIGKVKTKVLKNNSEGFKELIQWAEKNTKHPITDIHFVMEATGIYHEALAYALHGAVVSVINPAYIHNYAKSQGSRIKTDKKDSITIAHYGATHTCAPWQPEPSEIRQLKALLSRYESIDKDLQREGNRLEKAEITVASIDVIDSIKTMLKELGKEKQRIKKLIDDHIDRNPQLKNDRALLESIPAVGSVLSQHMLALIYSRHFATAKQCSAFIGLNPVMHEPRTSVRGRSRLSKVGDPKIRAKLYMASVVAIQHNPDIKQQYERLLKNGKSKMAALGAAMRKLVQICFGVLKHQISYQPQGN
ncbi:MAG: IS110 family transposase [Gammaproteobacteria bacterium]|nr:IS110 family transposase [Gammaproteobacteria bacterium]